GCDAHEGGGPVEEGRGLARSPHASQQVEPVHVLPIRGPGIRASRSGAALPQGTAATSPPGNEGVHEQAEKRSVKRGSRAIRCCRPVERGGDRRGTSAGRTPGVCAPRPARGPPIRGETGNGNP